MIIVEICWLPASTGELQTIKDGDSKVGNGDAKVDSYDAKVGSYGAKVGSYSLQKQT